MVNPNLDLFGIEELKTWVYETELHNRLLSKQVEPKRLVEI